MPVSKKIPPRLKFWNFQQKTKSAKTKKSPKIIKHCNTIKSLNKISTNYQNTVFRSINSKWTAIYKVKRQPEHSKLSYQHEWPLWLNRDSATSSWCGEAKVKNSEIYMVAKSD